MARTRSVSGSRTDGHRVRSPSLIRRSYSPVGSSQRTDQELQPAVRVRAKSSSPGPALIAARRTLRRGNGATPVLPTPSPTGHIWKSKIKRISGTKGGNSQDGDASGSSREGSVVSVRAYDAQERDKIPRALPDLPEDEEIDFGSSPRSSLVSRRSASLSNTRIAPQSLEPETSSTQRELEEMDTELVLESTSELDRNAQRLLDLLIVNPPEGDMLRSVRTQNSKVWKRLRVYFPAFEASKTVFGTSHFIDIDVVEAALGEGIYTPVIYRANLAILANFIYSASEEDDSTFQALKSIERYFPTQVGGVIDEHGLEFALDLRTQTVIRGMLSVRADCLEPDVFLRHFFMEQDLAGEATSGGSGFRCKSWPGSRDIGEWEGVIIERLHKIRSTFHFGGQNDGEESQEGRVHVDFEKLTSMFPWEEFVQRMADFIQKRLYELENSNHSSNTLGANEEALDAVPTRSTANEEPQLQLESGVMNPPAEPVVKETSDQNTSQISTEVDDVDYSQLPNAEDQTTEGQNTTSQADASQFTGVGPKLNIRTVRAIENALLAKEAQANAKTLPAPVNPESIATTVAQVNAIKKRKRQSEVTEMTERRDNEEARDTTPRYVVSETIMSNMAQMKHLKKAKKLLIQQEQSVPAPAPQPERPEAPKNPDELPSAGMDDGDGFEQTGIGNGGEGEGDEYVSDDPGCDAYMVIHREQDKENKKRGSSVPLPSTDRRKRQKRFTDPQEGAGRVTPIDEEGEVIATPPVRPAKGRGRQVARVFNQSEEESEFAPDEREINEDAINKSRRHLPHSPVPHSFRHSSPPVRVSNNSPPPHMDAMAAHNGHSPSRSPPQQTSEPDLALVPTSQMSRGQRGSVEEAGHLRYGPLDRRDIEVNHRLREVERINRLARINRAALHTVRKQSEFWSEEGTKALMQAIHEFGSSWAVIRDSGIPGLEGRSDVQLKDKARNLKLDMIKAKIALPLCFRVVTMKTKDKDILARMGIFPDEDGNWLEDPDRCSGHAFAV